MRRNRARYGAQSKPQCGSHRQDGDNEFTNHLRISLGSITWFNVHLDTHARCRVYMSIAKVGDCGKNSLHGS